MRVISGIYKRRRFEVPKSFKARPTTDFAKENIFNVLNKYLDFEESVKALDLFSGTGSISLELISRGCDKVVSVEKDYQHCMFISKVIKELNVNNWILIKGDAFKYISSCGEQFDFVFADPPYNISELSTIPDIVFSNNLLSERGVFVLEHGKDLDFSSHNRFQEHRVYGSVNFSIFKNRNIAI